jgi:hypothetical protein
MYDRQFEGKTGPLFYDVKKKNMKKEKTKKDTDGRGQSEKKKEKNPESRTTSTKSRSPNMGYHGKDDEKNLNPEE